jgi:hypothetical protein
MSFQPSQNQSKLVHFAKSGLCLLEAVILTSAIGAIASTQPGWSGAQSASARELPGSVSIVARDLGKPLEANCKPQNPDGIPEAKASFCGGVGAFEGDGTGTTQYAISTNPNVVIKPFNPEDLVDFMQSASAAGFNPPQDRVVLLTVPLF